MISFKLDKEQLKGVLVIEREHDHIVCIIVQCALRVSVPRYVHLYHMTHDDVCAHVRLHSSMRFCQ
jgi:hypothetical protein